MAIAIGAVLTTKYVKAIPESGQATATRSTVDDVPPSHRYTCPEASAVMTRIEILNSVR